MTLDTAIKFCLKHKLHLNEFVILYFTKEDSKLLDKYLNSFSYNGQISNVDKDKLLEEGFLESINDEYIVTDKFYNLFDIADLFETDIYDKYPGFVYTGAKRLTVKSGTLHELTQLYKKYVGTHEEHKEVELDLQFAINNDLIQFSITNFIGGYYKDIRKLRLGNNTASTPTNQNVEEE